MLFLDNRGVTDPALNLALEEYALRNLPADDSYLLFYINEPSIIIGKNQNTIEEINADFVRDNGIHVVRRLSGGGAVYHDLGNLNFSFITNDVGDSFHQFAAITKPVIDALHKLGVRAELTGRNDIQVGERKISGNARFATKGRMFTHGTLLFDTAMDNVASALNVKSIKIESKGTKSVRSRVANISEFLDHPMTTEQFRSELLRELFHCEPEDVPRYELSDRDWTAVGQLADERYRSWDWNYGLSPKCNIENIRKFASGIIDVRLNVEDGRMTGVKIFGDFFGAYDVAEVEQLLTGIHYEEEAIRLALESVQLSRYFGSLTEEEFINLLLLRD